MFLWYFIKASIGENNEAVTNYSIALKVARELLKESKADIHNHLLNQSITTFFHERAKSYQAINELELALNDFNEVISASPLNAHAFFRRAFVYKCLGYFEKAAEDFEKSKNLQPDNP